MDCKSWKRDNGETISLVVDTPSTKKENINIINKKRVRRIISGRKRKSLIRGITMIIMIITLIMIIIIIDIIHDSQWNKSYV